MAYRSYPNLFAYLKHSGRTQTELAHELGISVTMVSMLKWGHRQPTAHGRSRTSVTSRSSR